MEFSECSNFTNDGDNVNVLGRPGRQYRTGCKSRNRMTVFLYLFTVTVLFVVTAISILTIYASTGTTESGESSTGQPAPSILDILPEYADCGHPLTDERMFHRRNRRIIGGELIKSQNHFPWLAKLLYQRDPDGVPEFGCTAALITKRHLLTAAHCILCDTPTFVELRGEGPLKVDRIHSIPNPAYKRLCANGNNSSINHSNRAHDSGIITLVEEVKNSSPICLPLERFYKLNLSDLMLRPAAIVGWGATDPYGRGITTNSANLHLHAARISPYDTSDCKEIYENKAERDEITKEMFCAGDSNSNFCYGDSGAPYFVSLNNRSFVVGIASFGHSGCAPNVPSVFTKVTSQLNWILEFLLYGNSDDSRTV